MPQGWTLDVEIMFYLLLPLLAVIAAVTGRVPGSETTRRRLLYALLAVVTVGGIVLRSRVDSATSWHGRNLIALGHAFTPGILLAAIEPQVRPLLRGTQLGRHVAVALAGLLLVSFGLVVAFGLNDGQLAFELCAIGVGAGALAAPMVWQWATGRAPRLMDLRPLNALGRWSYSIYLLHVGVLLIVIQHVPSGIGAHAALAYVFVATSAISIAISMLTWWLVEEPFMLKRRPRAWWTTMARATERPNPPSEEVHPPDVLVGAPAPATAGPDAVR
jgi:peptidoglycan/LPS O-acetylase OafA/YrhL